MKNNKVKFIFVALLFATQVEAFSSCSTSSVNEDNKEQETPPDSPSVSPPVEETAYAFPGAEGGGGDLIDLQRYENDHSDRCALIRSSDSLPASGRGQRG